MKRTQRHLPVWPPFWRLDEGFKARLARGGTPLPIRPRVRVARPRTRRPVRAWQVAEFIGRITGAVVQGAVLGVVALILLVSVAGPFAYEMGWR